LDTHIRDLRYFLVVGQELHFTRAAERLFVSQPALSKQIRMLERQLGAPLFDRDRRTVRLTAVGAALLPYAQRVVEEWDVAFEAVREARSRQRATLTVGMSTSPGRGGLLPAIRSRFTEEHPEVGLTLHQVGWADATAGLEDGSSDVAFVWLPLPDASRYRWIVVAEEPRLVALPEGHPLAARESVEFAELLDLPFLALPEGAGPLRDYWLAVDERAGRAPEITGTEETYEALVGGVGVCLLASGNAPLVTLGGVTTRPVRGLSPCRLALAWRRQDDRPRVRAYVRAAASTIAGAGRA